MTQNSEELKAGIVKEAMRGVIERRGAKIIEHRFRYYNISKDFEELEEFNVEHGSPLDREEITELLIRLISDVVRNRPVRVYLDSSPKKGWMKTRN